MMGSYDVFAVERGRHGCLRLRKRRLDICPAAVVNPAGIGIYPSDSSVVAASSISS